jgi:Cu/Zn superoxide dismutase
MKGNFIYCYRTNKLSLEGSTNIIGRSIVIHKFIDDLGLMGQFDDKGVFTTYDKMSEIGLKNLYKSFGYSPEQIEPMNIIQRLKKESSTTGNAATRIACAIIGWSS